MRGLGAFHPPFGLLSPWQKLVVYFYNRICQCDSIQKESLLSPDVANPAEDLFRHSPKKGEDETNIPPKNSLTPPRRRHLRASVIKWGWTSPCGGSVFAALRRDKAVGVMRQRNRRAGGTPGANSPLAIKNQSTFSTQLIIFQVLKR